MKARNENSSGSARPQTKGLEQFQHGFYSRNAAMAAYLHTFLIPCSRVLRDIPARPTSSPLCQWQVTATFRAPVVGAAVRSASGRENAVASEATHPSPEIRMIASALAPQGVGERIDIRSL